ncbi:MAG: alcohol dehydrogenase catalytic domain-containing protein, partial [Leptospiraceae bacterium]|nr:alcohol dehydrogenase catalytic domain-containing protein [Leptospiraceae bacterium]
MLKRKVYSIRKTGSLSNLELKEEILPDPKEEEVCIQIRAIGLNFADLFAIFGLYSATPKGEFTPGLEYSGVVIKIGEKVT